jgi:hypothetical protein
MTFAQEASRFKKLPLDIENPKIEAYIDEETKTVLDHFLPGWKGVDVKAALKATEKVREATVLLYSYLDFSGKVFGQEVASNETPTQLPPEISLLSGEVRKLKMKKKLLPMFVAGANHYLSAFISAFGPVFGYEFTPVDNYDHFLEKINASRNDG